MNNLIHTNSNDNNDINNLIYCRDIIDVDG